MSDTMEALMNGATHAPHTRTAAASEAMERQRTGRERAAEAPAAVWIARAKGSCSGVASWVWWVWASVVLGVFMSLLGSVRR
jgi:hypothetical protein